MAAREAWLAQGPVGCRQHIWGFRSRSPPSGGRSRGVSQSLVIMPAPQRQSGFKRRRVKLIQPALQLRLVATSAAIAAIALGLQYVLFSSLLAELAASLPYNNALILEQGSSGLLKALGVSALLLFPLVLWIGIHSTFRIAGPLYRMKRFLEQVARGERPPDCRLRRRDQLQDLCHAINAATRPLRLEQPSSEEEPRRDAA